MSSGFIMAIASTLTNASLVNNTQITSPKYSIGTVILATLTTIICIGGLLGNVTIAAIILRGMRMHTSTNWLVFNLAICDIAIILITIPYNLIHPFINWPFGFIGCKYLIMPVMEHFAGVCVLTHAAVGLARYIIVNNAGTARRIVSNMVVRFTISIIWIVSFMVLSATLMGLLGEFKLVYRPDEEKVCQLFWLSVLKRKLYRLCVFFLTYVIPMIVTGYSYYRIHKKVANSLRNINRHLSHDMLLTRKRKTRRMDSILMTMYIMFAIATLPLQVFLFLLDFDLIPNYDQNKIIFDLLLQLFYAQVVTTPFTLFYMGEDYRKEIYRLPICCCLSMPQVRGLSLVLRGSIRGVTGKYKRYAKSSEFSTCTRRQLIEEEHISSNGNLYSSDQKSVSSGCSLNKMNHLNSINLNRDAYMCLGGIYERLHIPTVLQKNSSTRTFDNVPHNGDARYHLADNQTYADSKSTDSIERIISRTLTESLEHSDLSLDEINKNEVPNSTCGLQIITANNNGKPFTTRNDNDETFMNMHNCQLGARNSNKEYSIRNNRLINRANIYAHSHISSTIHDISSAKKENLKHESIDSKECISSNCYSNVIDIVDRIRSRTFTESSERLELSFDEAENVNEVLTAMSQVQSVTAYYDDGSIMYFHDPVIGRVSLAHDTGRETII